MDEFKCPGPYSFGPHFPVSVVSAIRRREAIESAREAKFKLLQSAFYRVGLAGAITCFLLAAWIRFQPSPHKGALEEIFKASFYQALEDQL